MCVLFAFTFYIPREKGNRKELKRKAMDEKQNDCLMPETILHAYIIGMEWNGI